MDLEKAAAILSSLTPVQTERTRCVRLRSARASCRRCLEICPAEAIHLDGGPQISEKCITCGLCVSACPTGVFRLEEPSDAQVVAKARRVTTDPVIFACKREAQALMSAAPGSVVVVPCIGYLSLGLLAGVMATGHRKLLLWRPAACDDCVLAAAPALAAAAAASLNELLPGSAVLGAPQPLPAAERQGDVGSGLDAALTAQDRRDFLGGALQGAGGLLGMLFGDWVKRPDPPKPRTLAPGGVARRRELLVEALNDLPVDGERKLPDRRRRTDPQCTLCPACSRLCPSGALRLAEADGACSLHWQPAACTGCNLCVEVCPMRAMTAGEPETAGPVRDRAVETLTTGTTAVCACGATYWHLPGGPDRCIACRMKAT